MNLFSGNAGRVVLIPDAGFPLAVKLAGWKGAPVMKSMLTGMGMAAQGNFQFLHTLRNFIYVYVFGDRIGDITVNGLGFATGCDGDTVSGLEHTWDYYQKNRVAALGSPVALAVGTRMSFNGFLTGFTANFSDTQSGLTQFGLRFHYIPPEG